MLMPQRDTVQFGNTEGDAAMSLRNKSVLVTGGAGFIGSHLVDRLLREQPDRVVVVDNFFLGNEENLSEAKSLFPDIALVRVDAGDLASMQDLVTRYQIDTLFSLAVAPLPTSLTYPSWTIQSNVSIATTACEIARRGLIDTLIHFSSSEAYGSARYVPMDEDHPHDALTPYAASKSAEDRIINSYVKTFGIRATIVRPFNNIGPRQNVGSYAGIVPIVVRKVLSGEPIYIHGDGLQTRDLTFVRDTVDFAVKIHDVNASSGMTLNVATGVETSINSLVRKLLTVLGKTNHPIVYTDPRPGDVMRHCGDVSALESLLGEVPAPLSEEALLETVDWFRRWIC